MAMNQMSLSAFLFADANYNRVGWRHPDAVADAGLRFERWVEFTRILEAAKFDMLFIADAVSAPGVDDHETFCRTAWIAGFEPLTLLSALSQVTKRLGLAGTVSTTWTEPYNTARMLASLDRLTNGRAGWNLVTSRNPDDALNFSKERHVEHGERYAMAEEFLDICRGLWDSFDDDAFLLDKESGQFVDPEKLHILNHRGKHFQVKGPLNVPRPVQGHPVVIQAGMSEPAREMAARGADCVFCALPDMDTAKQFYADVKGRMSKFGRDPDTLRILPGVTVYVARTQAEAEAKFDLLLSKTSVDYAIHQLGATLGMDFSGHSPDDPVPPLKPNAGYVDPEALFHDVRAQNLTLGQWALRFTASKSHFTLVGTPEKVADAMEAWFRGGASDGFNLLPPHVPGSIQDFAELVVPELQKRGIFRKDYEGRTLREHLGLNRRGDRSTRAEPAYAAS